MSLTRQFARRALLAATLGLTAAAGFLPATASAIAAFENRIGLFGVDVLIDEGWAVTNTVVNDSSFDILTNTGNTDPDPNGNNGISGGATDASIMSAGNANPFGEIEISAFVEIFITVARTDGVAESNFLEIAWSGGSVSVATLPGESAESMVGFELLDENGASLGGVELINGDITGDFFSDPFSLALQSSTTFTLLMTTYGHAVSPDTTAQVPEPAALSLLGLGLLATGYVRRRRS